MSRLWRATPEWLKEQKLSAHEADRLFEALAALADNEGHVERALAKVHGDNWDLTRVCNALRYLVDGPEEES